MEVIGHIQDIDDTNSRLWKWLRYDPFTNRECVSCIALPVCMGGCAHHAMAPAQYENRCGTFRFKHLEQIASFVEFVESEGSGVTAPVSTRKRQPVDLGLPSYDGDMAKG